MALQCTGSSPCWRGQPARAGVALQCAFDPEQADRIKVRTLRLALGGTVPLTTLGQGVTPLDPESPHAYWLLQNRAVSAPLAVRPAVGTGLLRCTSSLCRLVSRRSSDFMALQCAIDERLKANELETTDYVLPWHCTELITDMKKGRCRRARLSHEPFSSWPCAAKPHGGSNYQLPITTMSPDP
jgi:hypothetical protein